MKPNQIVNYAEIAIQTTGRQHLLLGNGFSIACDPIFKYNNIFEFAKQHGLTSRVEALFGHFGTTNFELVARALDDIKFVGRLFGLVDEVADLVIDESVQEIKESLIAAIAQTHLSTPDQINESKKAACVAFLKPYDNVFTTNYDLLLYWASMHGHANGDLEFQDGFRSSVEHPDAKYVVFNKRLGRNKGLFYMHGALHLFESRGEVRKHCWNRSDVTLTQNVIESLDHDVYPLFVAEGDSLRKLEHIQRSGYLWYCYQKLQSIETSLVVCGSSLGQSDEHILNAIGDSSCHNVWLGIYGGANSSAAAHMEVTAEKLHERRSMAKSFKPVKVNFYDVSTAPMWSAALDLPAIKKPPMAALMQNLRRTPQVGADQNR